MPKHMSEKTKQKIRIAARKNWHEKKRAQVLLANSRIALPSYSAVHTPKEITLTLTKEQADALFAMLLWMAGKYQKYV